MDDQQSRVKDAEASFRFGLDLFSVPPSLRNCLNSAFHATRVHHVRFTTESTVRLFRQYGVHEVDDRRSRVKDAEASFRFGLDLFSVPLSLRNCLNSAWTYVDSSCPSSPSNCDKFPDALHAAYVSISLHQFATSSASSLERRVLFVGGPSLLFCAASHSPLPFCAAR